MPTRRITAPLASAVLALTLASTTVAAEPPYGPRPPDAPSDLGDTDLLTARASVPGQRGDAVDDDCLAAARASNGGDTGTIVVCSHGGDGTSQRVSPSRSVDQSTRTGVPRAPDLVTLPGCLGPCITIPFGHVPPPVYYIDLSAIPEAPKGSDAWKIGKGELRAP